MHKLLENIMIALLFTCLPGMLVVIMGAVATKKKWNVKLLVPLSMGLSLALVVFIVWIFIKIDWWMLLLGLLLSLYIGLLFYYRWDERHLSKHPTKKK